MYKPNTCLFGTQKLVPRMFGLDKFHCSLSINLSLVILSPSPIVKL